MRAPYHNEAGTRHPAGHVEADVDLHIRLLISQLHYGNLERTNTSVDEVHGISKIEVAI